MRWRLVIVVALAAVIAYVALSALASSGPRTIDRPEPCPANAAWRVHPDGEWIDCEATT